MLDSSFIIFFGKYTKVILIRKDLHKHKDANPEMLRIFLLEYQRLYHKHKMVEVILFNPLIRSGTTRTNRKAKGKVLYHYP